MLAVGKEVWVVALFLENLTYSEQLILRQVINFAAVFENVSQKHLGVKMRQNLSLRDLNAV